MFFNFIILLSILLKQEFDTDKKVWVNTNKLIQNMRIHFIIVIIWKQTSFTSE